MGTELTVKDKVNQMIPAFNEALQGLGITGERFAKISILALRKSEDLQKCNLPSVMESLMNSASLGLEPNTSLQQAYLIPYKGECQFQLGYRGMVELARRSGQVKEIYADVVREGDQFRVIKGLNRDLIHIPDEAQTGKLTHCYAVCITKDGGLNFEVMTKADIDKILKNSPHKGASPAWKNWPEEMWKKTVLKRLCKILPASILPQVAHEALDREDSIYVPQPSPAMLSAGDLDYGGTQRDANATVIDTGNSAQDLENEEEDF